MANLRVVLIDDHPVVREGLRALVGAQPGMEVVGEAGDGAAVLARVRADAPDVVVMDVSMPGLNGAEATARLKGEFPGVKVLALTVHEEQSYVHQLLEAGADGYVLKRTAPDELVRAIRVVAAGGMYLDPAVAAGVVGGAVRKPPGGTGAAAGLSDREEEVVRLTASGYANKEIAARLDLSVKTVETYRARAATKLGLRGRAELVRYAISRGWLRDA